MGPALILDKSAFQALSADEHSECRFMFMENVTPVLLREIAGDLAKFDGNRPPEVLVQSLARKFGGSGGNVNVDWQHLCLGSLGGQEPAMTGQIVVGPEAIRNVTRSTEGTHVSMGPRNLSTRLRQRSLESYEANATAAAASASRRGVFAAA
jgi:hypothetical protein